MSIFTLRVKLTLALLFTGLASAVLVGVIARTIVLQRFEGIILENSFRFFQNDVIDYVATYGSWDAGAAVEGFGNFERRRNAPPGAAPAMGRDGKPLPPPRGATPRRTQTGPTQPRRGGGYGEEQMPPFRFLLLDPDGTRVLLGPDDYKLGRPVSNALRRSALPISVDGRVVALAIPLRQPNLTGYDRSYLTAMQDAVTYGVGGAGLLALALGFFFSDRLSRSVRALTRAFEAMARGELRQRVETRSRDEVGMMAQVFNRMSEDLADSHDKIRAQAEQLKELSIRDELTGLYNRCHFNEHAARAFSEARRYGHPLAAMICDIDHFKRINDTFSHATGDVVLRHVSRLLREHTRTSDIVARYGGEEFVAVFPQIGLDDAAAMCERIRKEVESFAWTQIHPDLRVTLSMGLDADLTRNTIEEMLQIADTRLYAAKQSGRNRVVIQSVA